MWACNNHMKEVLSFLDIPHISKASYQIKCTFCDKPAEAKVYYAHQPLKYKKKKEQVSTMISRTS